MSSHLNFGIRICLSYSISYCNRIGKLIFPSISKGSNRWICKGINEIICATICNDNGIVFPKYVTRKSFI